jgi:hypothetical protein
VLLLRRLALVAGFPLSILVACSSSSGNGPAAAADSGPIDGSLGPFFCDLPVPATCPTTAPCAFSAWGCAQPACDGYFVVTDGAWAYYYSSVGGELAGEVALDDASFVSCPYGFQPPTSCTPVIASRCSSDAGGSADAD